MMETDRSRADWSERVFHDLCEAVRVYGIDLGKTTTDARHRMAGIITGKTGQETNVTITRQTNGGNTHGKVTITLSSVRGITTINALTEDQWECLAYGNHRPLWIGNASATDALKNLNSLIRKLFQEVEH